MHDSVVGQVRWIDLGCLLTVMCRGMSLEDEIIRQRQALRAQYEEEERQAEAERQRLTIADRSQQSANGMIKELVSKLGRLGAKQTVFVSRSPGGLFSRNSVGGYTYKNEGFGYRLNMKFRWDFDRGDSYSHYYVMADKGIILIHERSEAEKGDLEKLASRWGVNIVMLPSDRNTFSAEVTWRGTPRYASTNSEGIPCLRGIFYPPPVLRAIQLGSRHNDVEADVSLREILGAKFASVEGKLDE